jgi:quinohemoprotein ethanol dehydrogenase
VPKDHDKYVCCDVVNRGVALYKGRVYVATLDGRLVALDAKTGSPVWDVQTTPKDGSYAITAAPRIAKGRVLIGNAGAEYPVRGYVSAYDAETGNLAWRTYTVPGDPSKPFESDAMKRAAATWSGEWWKAGGGGTAWESMVYDPELDLVYFGTGNATPWYDQLRGKGDSLYTASIVAVRADNGEQVWDYQTTPGDNFDYDATQPLLMATLAIDGAQRRVIMQANKNGFFYVIDRENGKFISARPFAPVNWATGIDSNGRPIENPAARQLKDAALVKPSAEGAHNWNPISFSPTTGLVYLAVLEDTSLHAIIPHWKINLHDQTTGSDRAYRGPARDAYLKMKNAGRLLAWDPVAQKEAWHVELPDPKSGGTLATAGNLVFQGRADGKATIPPYEHVVRPVPMPTFKLAASKAEIEEGRKLFANTCARCHGGEAISGGSVPDLRYATDPTHEMFEEIVLGGARREFGMPSFTGDVTSAQVRLIHAYILDRARESAQAYAAPK